MATENRPGGIVMVFSRPTDFAREAEWNEWYASEHLPATRAASGSVVATRWENTDRPHGAVAAVGFTHVAIYELHDVDKGSPALLAAFDSQRHPLHAIIGVEVMRPAGRRWNRRLEPGPHLTGQILAFVGPSDRTREDEWDRWVDDVHVVDMVESGAFANASRWKRAEPARFGLNYLSLYDVTLDDVDQAVNLSAAAMGPAKAKGRILDCHAGGLRAVLRPA